MKLFIFIFIVLLIFGVNLLWQTFLCSTRWPDHKTSYGYFSGCLIYTDKGFIPENNFRAN